VSHAVPAGSREVTVAFAFISEHTVTEAEVVVAPLNPHYNFTLNETFKNISPRFVL
jgi:hypothetical protein